jgi:hypothetical protein
VSADSSDESNRQRLGTSSLMSKMVVQKHNTRMGVVIGNMAND